MSRRVVVTGLGCVTPLGNSVRESWANLLASKSGIVGITSLPDYDNDYKQYSKSIPKTVSVGKVNFPEDDLLLFSDQDKRRLPQFSKYAVLATFEALMHANLLKPNSIEIDESRVNLDKFGCVIGSGIASIKDIYNTTIQFHNEKKKVNPLFVPRILTNMAAGNVSIKFKLRGACHSVSTACATGNNSIGDAYNFIRLGMQDICVAGASDASVHPLSLAGFLRAQSITPDGISRPFDAERSGFVLGEGAGILILESLESAIKRKADIICEVAGYGISSDAYHITSPLPDGSGAQRAIEMAISEIDKSDITYVNAHATSTVLGDRAETLAIKNSLINENESHSPHPIYVSSNKGSMGHLLGAAGTVESIFTIKALKESIIPHTLNLQNIDEEIKSNSKGLEFVMKNPKKIDKFQYALCNSFGFGGVNTTILFKQFNA